MEIESFPNHNNRLQGVLRALKNKETVYSTPTLELIKDRLDSAYSGVNAFNELNKIKSGHDQTKIFKKRQRNSIFSGLHSIQWREY